MNFKRKRRKNARAGCLLCKPHKGNGMCPRHQNMRHGNKRRYEADSDQLRYEGIAASGRAPRPLADGSDQYGLGIMDDDIPTRSTHA